jgi:putative transposase
VPWSLKRYYGTSNLHFITVSCYRRIRYLGTRRRRTLQLDLLEQTRQRYRFVVVGPETGTPSTVMQVLKQRFAKSVLPARRRYWPDTQRQLWNDDDEPRHIWQARFYDFNVWSKMKRIEQLRYMHENPVRRGLVLEAGQWAWSSFRDYAYDEPGRVRLNQWPAAVLKKAA